jgi:hypothetical protein
VSSGPSICTQIAAPSGTPASGTNWLWCDSTGLFPRAKDTNGVFYQYAKELTAGQYRITGGANAPDTGDSPAFATLTDGATVTWAIASNIVANADLTFTTHGGSRTLNITNPVNGGSYVLWLKQDATGGEGLTLGSGCTWKVSGGGAGAISPSIGANAVDVLAFTYDGNKLLCKL